jgi:hypothetical protein
VSLDIFSSGRILAGCLFSNFLDFLFLMQKENLYAWFIYFLFLCHHSEYSHELLHTADYSHGA